MLFINESKKCQPYLRARLSQGTITRKSSLTRDINLKRYKRGRNKNISRDNAVAISKVFWIFSILNCSYQRYCRYVCRDIPLTWFYLFYFPISYRAVKYPNGLVRIGLGSSRMFFVKKFRWRDHKHFNNRIRLRNNSCSEKKKNVRA